MVIIIRMCGTEPYAVEIIALSPPPTLPPLCMAFKFRISLHLSTFLLSTSLSFDSRKEENLERQVVINGDEDSNGGLGNVCL